METVELKDHCEECSYNAWNTYPNEKSYAQFSC